MNIGEVIMKKIILSTLFATTLTHAWVIDGVGEYRFEALNSQVHVIHGPMQDPNEKNYGFINNPAIIDGDNGLILIDPGNSKNTGINVVDEIAKVSSKPVVAVVNTHVHGDHWLANHAIKDKYPNAKFYAHMNMIREAEYGEGDRWIEIFNEMTAGKMKGTLPVIPKYSVEHQDTLKIEGQTLVFHSPFPASHSSSDIMIEHKESKTLFTGDNVFNRRLGRFAGDSNMIDNIEILKYAKNLDIDTVVPGHGPSGTVEQAIDPYLSYLSIIQEEVKKGYEEDLADYEIKPFANKRLASHHSWSGYEDQLGRHINKMLLEVESRDM